MEPDPVQPVGLHSEGVRNQLYRDAACTGQSVPLQVKKGFCFESLTPFFFGFVFRSMQTVEYGGCISPTDCTRRMSYRQSLNSICLFRTKKLRFGHTPANFCKINKNNNNSDICMFICLSLLAAVNVKLHLFSP